MFYHFIDPIVDYQHSDLKRICGFVPFDEPLLKEVFVNKKYKIKKSYQFRFMLPDPEILLGCKIHSVSNRRHEDKRIKDIIDIYSLIWHSGIKTATLRKRLSTLIAERTIYDVLSSISKEEYEQAAEAIDLKHQDLSSVVENFSRL